MRGCECPAPHDSPDPRKHRVCGRCDKLKEGPGVSTEETFNQFHDWLEEGFFRQWSATEKANNPKGEEVERQFYRALRELARRREDAGKETFGLAYLGRDNIAEVYEEIADVFNYCYEEDLKTFRRFGDHREIDTLMEGLRLIYLGTEMIGGYKRKIRGSP